MFRGLQKIFKSFYGWLIIFPSYSYKRFTIAQLFLILYKNRSIFPQPFYICRVAIHARQFFGSVSLRRATVRGFIYTQLHSLDRMNADSRS